MTEMSEPGGGFGQDSVRTSRSALSEGQIPAIASRTHSFRHPVKTNPDVRILLSQMSERYGGRGSPEHLRGKKAADARTSRSEGGGYRLATSDNSVLSSLPGKVGRSGVHTLGHLGQPGRGRRFRRRPAKSRSRAFAGRLVRSAQPLLLSTPALPLVRLIGLRHSLLPESVGYSWSTLRAGIRAPSTVSRLEPTAAR